MFFSASNGINSAGLSFQFSLNQKKKIPWLFPSTLKDFFPNYLISWLEFHPAVSTVNIVNIQSWCQIIILWYKSLTFQGKVHSSNATVEFNYTKHFVRHFDFSINYIVTRPFLKEGCWYKRSQGVAWLLCFLSFFSGETIWVVAQFPCSLSEKVPV